MWCAVARVTAAHHGEKAVATFLGNMHERGADVDGAVYRAVLEGYEEGNNMTAVYELLSRYCVCVCMYI